MIQFSSIRTKAFAWSRNRTHLDQDPNIQDLAQEHQTLQREYTCTSLITCSLLVSFNNAFSTVYVTVPNERMIVC
jgi:hypothetical protein